MYGSTEAVSENRIEALGIHRIAIPIPFRDAGGPVNVYSIDNGDGTLTLFDTGYGSPAAIDALKQGFVDRRLRLESVSRIVVSHGHIDHFCNAQMLAQMTGAPVYMHPGDIGKITADPSFFGVVDRSRDFLFQLGVPRDVYESLLHAARTSEVIPSIVDPSRVKALHEGDVMRFRDFDASVLHMPGHTPGLICLHAAAEGLLFSNDHVLERVSPNPLIDLSRGTGATKFRALIEYVGSATRASQLELTAILPGHGPAFRGHQSLIAGLFQFYRRRQEKLLARLRQSPSSVYDLLPAIFIRVDVARLWLMLSEVLANLEVLEHEGRVVRSDRHGVFEYEAAPDLPASQSS